MTRSLTIAVALISVTGASAAFASNSCDVPTDRWKPAEALQEKLTTEGWQVKRIKTEDGCYEAYAIDEKGRRVEAKFRPDTLAMVKMEQGD
jgi:hypothetical protein